MEIAFGHYKDGVLYRTAFAENEDLKLREVEEAELQQSIEFFTGRFEQLNKKLTDIEEKVNATTNKGSFLSSLQNIKMNIPTHEGLGDYTDLIGRIERLENLINDIIEKNRHKNIDIKRALLLELDEVLQNNDLTEAFEQIKDLRMRWLKTGSVGEELKEEIEGKFKSGVDSFFEKKNAFSEDKKHLVELRINKYTEIIEAIKSKVENYSQKASGELKELQSEWKEVGRIPTEDFKRLNDEYWKVCQAFFGVQKEKQKEARKNSKENEKQALESRNSLIEKLKELAADNFSRDLAKELNQLKKDWKNAGHLSKQKFGEIHQSYLDLVNELSEKQFIFQLANRKFKGFKEKGPKERLQDLTKVIRDLLSRDQNELSSFQENMDKMSFNKGSFVDMLESKLKNQEQKVALKKRLLNECREQLKQL